MEQAIKKVLIEASEQVAGENQITIREFIDRIDFTEVEKAEQKSLDINPKDYDWRFKTRNVINRIRTIIESPRMHIKTERDVILAAVASKVDSVGMNQTFRDPRLWKVKGQDKHLEPERVYATLFEDEIAIYENKFIALLIDMMYRHITLEISRLFSRVGKFDSLVIGKQLNLGDIDPIIKHSDFFYAEKSLNSKLETKRKKGSKQDIKVVPFLTTHTNDIIVLLQDLLDLRTRIVHFFETKFYKICKKAGKMSAADVCPTNILTQDPDYNFCYLFFRELLVIQKKHTIRTDRQAIVYSNYVMMRIVVALGKLGFVPQDENFKITWLEDGTYVLNEVPFTKGFAHLTLTCVDGQFAEVKVELDQNKNKFIKDADLSGKRRASFALELFPSIQSADKSDDYMNVLFTEVVQKRLDEGYDNCYIITDRVELKINNAILCSLTDHKLDVTLDNMVKSFFILTQGDSFVYAKRCPICGTMGVEYDKGNYNCLMCGSIYSILRFGGNDERKEILWIKRAVRPFNTDLAD